MEMVEVVVVVEVVEGVVEEVVSTIERTEVELSRRTSGLPWLTVNTGVTLPIPLESPRTIATSVPTGIVT
jgi:hypothetical protein